MIERFSEDVDLAINREALGFGGDLSISEIKKLKRKGAEFTSGEFKDAIDKALKEMGILFLQYSIKATPIKPDLPDTDPQELFVEYISMLEPNPYVLPKVKIEMSVRSLTETVFERTITSLMDEAIIGQAYAGEPFTVSAIDPRITILEKIFLMHEEFTKPAERIDPYRMSRHLHDLERTMDTEYGNGAINDYDLYLKVFEHRKHFIRHRHVNYDSHGQSTIQFIPPNEWLPSFKEDYEKMKLEMFRGDVPAFDELIARLSELQNRIRNSTELFW